ncbi:hydrolase [Streptomyces camponoticapitis]|uniref:Hydrolase n=1 Tax=Streptomyces camponoticapitis TaxID=1616125 RepID=A0ABQ2E2G8_9ACTN|nr:fibronectin type III domain-containing protein [Streptomyces camponoticapitis]GGJ90234.1 hydrolase [Streptomyces camponoticapitis]
MRRTPTQVALVTATALALVACGGGGDDKDSEAPSAPTGFSVQAGSALSAHVMWEAAKDNVAVSGYVVYRGKDKIKDVPAEKLMIDITGLKPSTAYSFSVRAKDAAGNLSPHSQRKPVTTPAVTPEDKKAPARPVKLRGKHRGSKGAELTWSAPDKDQGITSYDILQGGSKIHSVGGDATRAEVGGLRPGTDYSFTLQARDAADNTSPASEPLKISTPKGPGDDPDTAPISFKVARHKNVKEGAYYLDLSWLPPKVDGEVPSYEIHLNGNLTTTLVWGNKPPEGRTTESVFAGKKPGVSYKVKIRAKLPDGEWGSFSPELTMVTGEAKP